jgi:predicted metal-dependent hydrolase
VDNQSDPFTVNKLKSAAYWIKMIMSISVAALFIFTITKYVYAVFRVNILLNEAMNLGAACFWIYDGTIACMLIYIAIIFKYVIFVS